MKPQQGQRLVALFVVGMLLFGYPLLTIFSRPVLVLGVPLLYLYLFVTWLVLIAIAGWLMERGGDPRPPAEGP